MTKFIPVVAVALVATTIATPVFAQAAIQEPGAFAFSHPNADVLAGRYAVRPVDQSFAYYGTAVPARDRLPGAPRYHRRPVR